MGYPVYYDGKIEIAPPLTEEHAAHTSSGGSWVNPANAAMFAMLIRNPHHPA